MKMVWFRNDLRTGDHSALYHACLNSCGEGVLALATLTPQQWAIQDESKCRVQFWLACLEQLAAQLEQINIPLKIITVDNNTMLPLAIINLAKQYGVTDLFFNREYPEYEQRRDTAVINLCQAGGIRCHQYESDLIIAPGRVINRQGGTYKVFTPFAKTWRQVYLTEMPRPLPAPKAQMKLNIQSDPVPAPLAFKYSLQMGADWSADIWPAGAEVAHHILQRFVIERFSSYPEERDIPGLTSTSSLSPYFSVGCITARQCMAAVQAYSTEPEWFDSQWVNELIWREFYRHLIVLFPEINRLTPFKPDVEARLEWENNPEAFEAWCAGETGFAIVDAGMKQLLETGWMHNRVRMITASFLTKLLRQDWRKGARFFMQHLIDGDFASNQGGWQWSASVGADAAPYFRIFNPLRQAERFDPQGRYVAQWLPELEGLTAVQQHDPLFVSSARPLPIIDYKQQRELSLAIYNN